MSRYIFKPHQSKRERLRRLQQAYRGVLPRAQFANQQEYDEAVEVYLALVSQGRV